ncbi:AAA family ATPase [Streptomyces longwoodensis]|uniref:AAA family ATPase n=1 Tax=Streptomyces longwoodensis TaxID=68231 RepID=UPI0037BB64AC
MLHEQRQRARLERFGFTPVHRILLSGPPGTGKSMTAAALAGELKLPLFTIRLDGLISRFMGETAAKLRLVFDAVAQTRAVYLFDEFDALGAERAAGNDVGEARRILNSFLLFLDEAPSESLVVAGTNHHQLLDRALFRRFDMIATRPTHARAGRAGHAPTASRNRYRHSTVGRRDRECIRSEPCRACQSSGSSS